MCVRWHSISVALVALASLSSAAKERISILDFPRVGAAAQKALTIEEVQDLAQQVRDVSTGLIDPSRFEVMTRENILVMLPAGKKDLSECEGQCEVETARNLGSRWHVVGDVKKVGSKHWGDDEGRAGEFAWHRGNSGDHTHPVRQKKANAWGLYDMAGNVEEWTSDWYGSYPSGEQRNPTGSMSGSLRVYRGGGWVFYPAGLSSSFRLRWSPDARFNYVGFRCVLSGA